MIVAAADQMSWPDAVVMVALFALFGVIAWRGLS